VAAGAVEKENGGVKIHSMSVDKYEREYHLTPTGWVKGSFAFYGTADNPAARPKEAVLTIVKEVEQSSPFSAESISWREQWQSPKAARQIGRLRKKFGKFPIHAE
jgi:hypothetical protein